MQQISKKGGDESKQTYHVIGPTNIACVQVGSRHEPQKHFEATWTTARWRIKRRYESHRADNSDSTADIVNVSVETVQANIY